eukprot:SAG11_NODE_8074_length_1062_cov_1.930426_1_plen_245_part_10
MVWCVCRVDVLAHLKIWFDIVAGDAAHPGEPPQALAIDEARQYSIACATADVIVLGVVRGLALSVAVLCASCGDNENDLSPPNSLSRPLLTSVQTEPRAPSFALQRSTMFFLCFQFLIFGAGVAKAVLSTAHCTDADASALDPHMSTPWVHAEERKLLVFGSAALALFEMLGFGLQALLQLRAAAAATRALLENGSQNRKMRMASLGRLVGLVKKESGLLIVALVMLVISTMTSLSLPMVAGLIV